MPSYFKRYYLDDVKLAQRALLEFYRSLHSGRMIAFTGSATTRDKGYGSWEELIDAYARIASNVVKATTPDRKEQLTPVRDLIRQPARHAERIARILAYRDHESRFDVRVALGLMEEVVLSPIKEGQPRDLTEALQNRSDHFELDAMREPIDVLSVEIARYFRSPHRTFPSSGYARAIAANASDMDVVKALRCSLGIRRFATLNYDLEIERQVMLGDVEKPFDELCRLRRSSGESFDWRLDSGRIRRALANGQAIESDILNRDRIDRMLEFAIGADDVDHHILHLHGRACDPSSMILSYRDYDRLYRSNDLYKLPFEFAQRIMIGGNPVLFVGLGMSEAEVNKSLEDFVSSSPYQRMAPTFLFWNYHKARGDMGKKDWSEVEMLRLDRFHRLGVLTIFDVDIAPDEQGPASRPQAIIRPLPRAKPGDDDKKKKGIEARRSVAEVQNLHWLVEQAAPFAERIAARENHVKAERWRNMVARVREIEGQPVVMWDVEDGLSSEPDAAALKAPLDKMRGLVATARNSSLCIVGPQGRGQGALALGLVKEPGYLDILPEHRLLINGGFSFDTDSLLDGIVRFLDARMGGYTDPDPALAKPLTSRGEYFRNLKVRAATDGANRPPMLIIIAGMSRFFSIKGDLLSAELDELIGLIVKDHIPNVTWLFMGSERMTDHMRARGVRVERAEECDLVAAPDPERLPSERLIAIGDAYEEALKGRKPVAQLDPARHRMLRDEWTRHHAQSTSRISGDTIELCSAFYDLYLGHAFNQALERVAETANAGGDPKAQVALGRELLRALAFIGIPTDATVLSQVPRVKAMVATYKGLKETEILDALVMLRLVIKVKGHGIGKASQFRYALPRSLLTELRYRFSVPLSEAKLSTAFNMSLYVAQPVDGFIPEPDIHDELGEIIDHLMGAYRDEDAILKNRQQDPALWDALAIAARAVSFHERPPVKASGKSRPSVTAMERIAAKQIQQIDALCRPAHAERLRAALALVRGYYTTTDLLTLDVGDRLIREDRDGILLEHAERLDTLIDAYGKVALAKAALFDAMGDTAQWQEEYGLIEPFYPDEMVWLHNERGVVRLVMGDLDEAAVSFERAFDINQRHVERRDRAHNWRRIRLNQLTLDIERGEMGLVLRRVKEVLAISPPPEPVDKSDTTSEPADKSAPAPKSEPSTGTEKKYEKPPHEDRLAAAIARGYRGRALHLQGDMDAAEQDYIFATRQLAELGESRAQAYFLRLYAELGGESRAENIQLALTMANATRQMDIVYRLRIMLALDTLSRTDDGSEAIDRPRAHRVLDEAVRYALQTDMHRVRVEAGAALGTARLLSGDYEGALRSISDGLMVATRFGMELSKIYLRSLMARVMAKRGHPITASKLALTTIRIASRRKYQQAIEHAEETMLTIPRVSSITDVIDASARRQL